MENNKIDKNKIINDASAFPKLLGASLGDFCKDLTEVSIDSIIKEGFLKDIPIIGALIGVCKLSIGIHERNLLKQSVEFINSFNTGNIDYKRVDKYRNEINSNPQKAEKELGRCLLIMNSTIEVVHSRLLGNLFKSYVFGDISWDKFVELSDAAHRLFIEDIRYLEEIDRNPDEYVQVEAENVYNYFRLQSLGFLTSGHGFFEFDVENVDSTVFMLSSFGKTFIETSGLRKIKLD